MSEAHSPYPEDKDPHAGDVSAENSDTQAAPAPAPEQKARFRDYATGAHVGRLVLSHVVARSGAKNHSRLQASQADAFAERLDPALARRRQLRQTAAMLGAAAAGYYLVREFDAPPLALGAATGGRILNKSTSVAERGTLVSPEQSQTVAERFRDYRQRRRERKAAKLG